MEKLPLKIILRINIVRILLVLENFILSFSKSFLILLVFLIISFFGFFKEVNFWIHLFLLMLFLLPFLYTFISSLKKSRYISLNKATHWLEKQHNIKHRPFSSLLDRPAHLDKTNTTIWLTHKTDMLDRAKNITIRLPKNVFRNIDPLALRFPVFTILLISFYFVEVNEGVVANLENTFTPKIISKKLEVGELTAWVSPPKYTKISQIYLSSIFKNLKNNDPIKIPQGSVLSLRLYGGDKEAILETESNETPFMRLDSDNLTAEISIENDGVYIVKRGSANIGGWKFELIPDKKPNVKYISKPSGTHRGSLRLEYFANDDYGLNSVAAYVQLKEDNDIFNNSLKIDLPMLNYGAAESGGVSFHDYTDHVWAGSKVIIYIEAKDYLNQIGSSKELEIIFPERIFNNPTAKSIITHRKTFALNTKKNIEVSNSLETIYSNSSSFNNDENIKENMIESIKILRSFSENNKEQYEEVVSLLWSSAIRIEDGNLSVAENELRDSKDKLSESLREGTGSDEMDAMISDLDQALKNFLEEMDNKTTDQLGDGEGQNQQDEDSSNENLKGDLTDMVEEIADLAGTGSPEEAQNKLNELMEVTENMDRTGERRLGENGEMDQRQALMQQIQELMGEQEMLMEESFHQAARQGFADQNSPGAGMKDAPKQQENLRKALGDVMREIGEIESNIPQELGRAERAMRQASRELQRGRPDRAADAQARAMDMMRRGAQSMENMMMGDGLALMEGGKNSNKEDTLSRDPLGRIPPGIGNTAGGFVGIPAGREIRKAKDIVNELYKRSSDNDRSALERAYIDRLLDWY